MLQISKMFYYEEDHAIKLLRIQKENLGFFPVHNLQLSTSQRYLWPCFGLSNSSFYIVDPSSDAVLNYLIPVAKCFIHGSFNPLPIVVLTDSKQSAVHIEKLIKAELSRQKKFCSQFNIEHSVRISDNGTSISNAKAPCLNIIHGEPNLSFEKFKAVILDVEEVNQNVQSILCVVERFQKKYQFQIILLCRKVSSTFLNLVNWEASMDDAEFNQGVTKVALVCGISEACLTAPIRHFAFLINNETVLWSDVLLRIVETIDCNMAIFCDSDSNVRAISQFLDSNCVR